MTKATRTRGLVERRKAGPVIRAEGHRLARERRGDRGAGPCVPEVGVGHREAVPRLHGDVGHLGSGVAEAFACRARRRTPKMDGREDIPETINRRAMRIAKDVASRKCRQDRGAR